ncbi:hypothetical protein MHYP_G00153120 [Metynnis hypsauchen]
MPGSILECGHVVMVRCSRGQVEQLERVQYRALKMISGTVSRSTWLGREEEKDLLSLNPSLTSSQRVHGHFQTAHSTAAAQTGVPAVRPECFTSGGSD